MILTVRFWKMYIPSVSVASDELASEELLLLMVFRV
jgi:hypothetical protein